MGGLHKACHPEKGKVDTTVFSMGRPPQGVNEYKRSSIGATLEAGYYSTLPFHLIEILIDIIRDLCAIMKDYPVHTLPSFPQFYILQNSSIIFQY